MEAGQRVRLKSDPGRVGVLTGRFRERNKTLQYQIIFPEGSSYQPEYEIEVIDSESDDPFILLEKGRFGRVSELRRNLSHIQLSGRLANMVYSMDTTNTDFYAYQYKPVLSFLESPSNGLLIADEVGLGKTIEAGLIWTEAEAMMTDALKCACAVWWKSFDPQVLKPVSEKIRGGKKELQSLKERPQYPGRHVNVLAEIKRNMAILKSDIKVWQDELAIKTGQGKSVRDAIESWLCPEALPAPPPRQAGLTWEPGLAEPEMCDQLSDLNTNL